MWQRPPAASTLIVLTGPSHAGKTTLARALQAAAAPRTTAYVAIDGLMEAITVTPDTDAWPVGLPVAYEMATAGLEAMAGRRSVVLFESTFTFVPPGEEEPQFHEEQLQTVMRLGSACYRDCVVVRVSATEASLLERGRATNRFSPDLLSAIAALHRQHPLSALHPVEISSDAESADASARRILSALGDLAA